MSFTQSILKAGLETLTDPIIIPAEDDIQETAGEPPVIVNPVQENEVAVVLAATESAS